MEQAPNVSGRYEQYNREIGVLREELLNLKHCQITFLTYSVTATGVLLGLGTLFSSGPVLGIVFLFPLVFLLPAWWIFFDKATSITRVVGYYRVLETLILDKRYRAPSYKGWENSLREFRLLQVQGKLDCPKEHKCQWWHVRLRDVFNSKTGHRYWILCYCIFFTLSILCVLVSIIFALLYWFWPFFLVTVMASIIFGVSACWNIKLVHKLICGSHQYNCNECFWKKILDLTYS
jgi:hypothetical protein